MKARKKGELEFRSDLDTCSGVSLDFGSHGSDLKSLWPSQRMEKGRFYEVLTSQILYVRGIIRSEL